MELWVYLRKINIKTPFESSISFCARLKLEPENANGLVTSVVIAVPGNLPPMQLAQITEFTYPLSTIDPLRPPPTSALYKISLSLLCSTPFFSSHPAQCTTNGLNLWILQQTDVFRPCLFVLFPKHFWKWMRKWIGMFLSGVIECHPTKRCRKNWVEVLKASVFVCRKKWWVNICLIRLDVSKKWHFLFIKRSIVANEMTIVNIHNLFMYS